MGVGEMLVIDNVLIPAVVERVQTEARDACEPPKLVLTLQSPIDTHALGADPSDKATLLSCDGSSVKSTVFARPPFLTRDKRFQLDQGLEPLGHPDRGLRRWHCVDAHGKFSAVEVQRTAMVGSERYGRPQGEGCVVGVEPIEGVEGGHTGPVRPARCESEVLCAAQPECRSLGREEDSCTRKNCPFARLDSSNRVNSTAGCATSDRRNRGSRNDRKRSLVGYTPYAMPVLGGVTRLGVFAPGDDGFFGLERTMDLFRSAGVSLVIQLGEALLPRWTARSADIDHLRRLLGRRQQAMLVCTDDLGRAVELRRAGGWDTGVRMVRPNLIHLDPGFSTRLFNDTMFVVMGPDPTALEHADDGPSGLRFASGGRPEPLDQVGLAVSATHPDLTQVLRELTPKLLISGGHGDFLDETYPRDPAEAGLPGSRVIVFGNRAGQRINHAIVHLTDGTVTLVPEPSSRGQDPAADHRRTEKL